MKYGKDKLDKAYARVVMNHNLKDYVRKQEIIYLEDFFNYGIRRNHAG